MITEDYVSFETAKLLKEKGFDVWGDDSGIEIYKEYSPSGLLKSCATSKPHPKGYPAPTLQMVMKWLREKEWFICIIPLAFHWGEKAVKFGYDIWADDDLEVDEVNTPEFNTYEEACESAINYCLKNL